MSKNKVTSKRVARIASKVLLDNRLSKRVKIPAGSALSQRPGKSHHRRKK